MTTDLPASQARFEDYLLPSSLQSADLARTRLGPLGGGPSASVDAKGWIAPAGKPWSLDWAVRDGEGWHHAADSAMVSQQLAPPAVVETTITLSSGGQVIQRVAIAVAGGHSTVTVEFENRSSVAVALALGIRPFGTGSSGIESIRLLARGAHVDGQLALTFDSGPRATNFGTLASGDIFASLETAAAATATPSPIACPERGASAALVWPLPHTASLRVAIPLIESASPDALVATPGDVNRGWRRHLENGFSFSVPDATMTDISAVAMRDLLTSRPEGPHVPRRIAALAESGFASDASGWVALLPAEDPSGTLAAIGRVVQLGEAQTFGLAADLAEADGGQLAEPSWVADNVEPVARAAYALHRQGRRRGSNGVDAVPYWCRGASFHVLAELLRGEGQPDVAERVESVSSFFASDAMPASDGYERLRSMIDALAPTMTWLDRAAEAQDSGSSSAEWLLRMRRLLLVDHGTQLSLLPTIPRSWRGEDIDAFNLPIEGGRLSFGLRWHGPRPALLWQIEPKAEPLPWVLSVPGIDAAWKATDLSGEDLLPDPQWPTD